MKLPRIEKLDLRDKLGFLNQRAIYESHRIARGNLMDGILDQGYFLPVQPWMEDLDRYHRGLW